MNKQILIDLPYNSYILIENDGYTARIESKFSGVNPSEISDARLSASLITIESLVFAQYRTGIDVTDSAYIKALTDCVKNRFFDLQ